MTHGRFLLLIAAIVGAWAVLSGHPLYVRLAYVLVAVVAVAAALTWASVEGVEIRRHTRSGRAQVGELAEETFRVHNTGWLPKLWLEVRDESTLPGHRASRVVSRLGPGSHRTWTVRTRCRRRGAYTLGPLTIAGGDPLGLFRRERELPRTATFVVYPRTVPLPGIDLPTGYLSGGQVVRQRAQFTTTNVRGVRSYQPGDAFNRIHWPTTARRGQLYTKEFELDPIADFWVLVDLQREVHTGTPRQDTSDSEPVLPWMEGPSEDELALEPTTEEYAVTIAASLARHFLEAGRSVGLIAYGQRRVVVQPDRGDRQLMKLLGHLAVLRAAGRSGLSEVLSAEGNELTRHATLVVVTPSTALRWIDALRELQYRGVGSMAVLVEANTFGPAGSSMAAVSALAANGVASRLIKKGADLAAALGGTSHG